MTITSIRVPGRSANVLWTRPGAAPRRRTRRIGRSGPPSIDSLNELLLGGWFEMSPHVGLPGRLDGRATMLHGEACRLPWRIDAADRSSVDATTRGVRYPLSMGRRIAVDGDTVTARSVLCNISARAWTVSHGEHPCFDRATFAGAVVSAEVRSARVLEPFDPNAASLRPGRFDWPWADGLDTRRHDVSIVPGRPTGAQDHIAVALASPTIRVVAPSGLVARLEVDRERHPYVLFWRDFRAPRGTGVDRWDVFALEPQSTLGFGVVDAEPADLTVLEPGQALTTQVSLTLTTAAQEDQ